MAIVPATPRAAAGLRDDAAPARPRVARRPLVAAGVLAGGGVAALIVANDAVDRPALTAACVLLVGGAFLGAALIVWRRRPGDSIGVLLAATGFAWWAGALALSGLSLAYTVGIACDALYAALIVHLLLALPAGRVADAAGRIVVGGAYATATLLQLPSLLFEPSPGSGPSNLLLVRADRRLSDVLDLVQLAAAAAVLAATAILVWRGTLTAGRLARRRAWPVAAAGTLTLALVVAAAAVDDVAAAPDGGLEAAALIAAGAVPLALLAGLTRARTASTAIAAALAARVGRPADPAELRAALAGALGDPDLGLAHRLAGDGRFVDAHGRRVAVEDDPAWRPLEHAGRIVGALRPGPALAAEPELLEAAASVAGLAMENQGLAAELRARIADLRASRARLVEAADTERRRLERDLHDGAQQRLVSLLLTVGLERRRAAADPAAAASLLDAVEAQLAAALAELRDLAHGILPPALTDHGLGVALDELAGRSPVPVEVVREPAGRLPPRVEYTAYFVVAEALTNAAKHARATRVTVSVAPAGGGVVVEVDDDGTGGADPARGSGLRGLEDRVAAIGGRLTVDGRPGRGTRVRAELPCAS